MRRKPGFTLVELLVVIAIIAVLIGILLPTLRKARQKAMDVSCASAMRQCLLGVFMYNNQYRSGLQNYSPACQFWGQGWVGGWGPWATAVHWNTIVDANGASNYHQANEGRSGASYSRGYLIQARILGKVDAAGNVINSDGLGCPACASVDDNSAYWGSNGSWSSLWGGNQVEPVSNQLSLRQNPSFIWYGPGASCSQQVSWYTGGNLLYANDSGIPTANFYKTRRPLLTCPSVFHYLTPGVGTTKMYQKGHRPTYTSNDIIGAYAENVGFSDGSVRFYESAAGGRFDPQ